MSRCFELGHCDLESPVISCANAGKKNRSWGRYKSRMRCDLLFLLSFGAIADVGVVGRWSSWSKVERFRCVGWIRKVRFAFCFATSTSTILRSRMSHLKHDMKLFARLRLNGREKATKIPITWSPACCLKA